MGSGTGGNAPANNPNPAINNLVQVTVPTFVFSPWQKNIDLSTKVGTALWSNGIETMQNKFS